MEVFLKYDINVIFKKTLKDQLDKLGVAYEINGLGRILFKKQPSIEQIKELTVLLSVYGIQIIQDHKSEIVQRIKDTIFEMIISSTSERQYKTSVYLSEKLGYSYTYLSSLFSDSTHNSIENYIILRRIDFAKALIVEDQHTLTEVALKLGYSSVAHLSTQFKKTTGLTPTIFQRIIKERKNNYSNS